MKSLVLYDSQFGNTEKIAQAIAKSIGAKAVTARNVVMTDLHNLDLLVVGSPTHGGRATEKLQSVLDRIPAGTLKYTNIAVFDTRFLEKDLNLALKLLVRTIGYAAPKLEKQLASKGGTLVLPPEGFIVKGKEGPLVPGELDRAKKWIHTMES